MKLTKGEVSVRENFCEETLLQASHLGLCKYLMHCWWLFIVCFNDFAVYCTVGVFVEYALTFTVLLAIRYG